MHYNDEKSSRDSRVVAARRDTQTQSIAHTIPSLLRSGWSTHRKRQCSHSYIFSIELPPYITQNIIPPGPILLPFRMVFSLTFSSAPSPDVFGKKALDETVPASIFGATTPFLAQSTTSSRVLKNGPYGVWYLVRPGQECQGRTQTKMQSKTAHAYLRVHLLSLFLFFY